RRDEEGGDSVLTLYFREMSNHQVMGADEELQAAEAVENAEVDVWCKLLEYLPAAGRLVSELEVDLLALPDEDRPDMSTVEGLKKLITKFEKSGKLTHKELEKWHEYSAELGRNLRMPDSDRLWMNRALSTARSLTVE